MVGLTGFSDGLRIDFQYSVVSPEAIEKVGLNNNTGRTFSLVPGWRMVC
jgi:hypothetical protein